MLFLLQKQRFFVICDSPGAAKKKKKQPLKFKTICESIIRSGTKMKKWMKEKKMKKAKKVKKTTRAEFKMNLGDPG